MIELIPAIDIIDGKCVRLTKGDYTQQTTYSDSPADVARRFEDMGFKRLHVVDLDGAKSRHIVNKKCLNDISRLTSLEIDFGGGLKTDDDIQTAFDNGASMVTVGSVAISAPDLFAKWIGTFGADKIILGADTRDGKVSINGWKEDSATDISKDGTMQGPAISLYEEIMRRHPSLHLIASGGVSGNDDIVNLDRSGIPAVVFGKAFYEGRIDIDKLRENV